MSELAKKIVNKMRVHQNNTVRELEPIDVELSGDYFICKVGDNQVLRLSKLAGPLLRGEFEPDDCDCNQIIAPPGILTDSTTATKETIPADMPTYLLRKWVGLPPKNPVMNTEIETKFTLMTELLQSNTNPKELRLLLEEFQGKFDEIEEWNEYEMRMEAARKVYARMERRRLRRPWNVVKRFIYRVVQTVIKLRSQKRITEEAQPMLTA